MPRLSPAEYAEEGGFRCPFCLSVNIVLLDSDGTYEKMGCEDCSKIWTNDFVLVGYVVEENK